MAAERLDIPAECRTEHPHVARYPGVQGGTPVIVGTRLDIATIAAYHRRHGYTVNDLLAAYPHITLAQMHDALSYYYDHQEEIDELIRERNDIERWRKEIEQVNALRKNSAG